MYILRICSKHGCSKVLLGLSWVSAKNATGASNINMFVSASGKPVQQERNTFQSRMELNAFSSHLFFTFL